MPRVVLDVRYSRKLKGWTLIARGASVKSPLVHELKQVAVDVGQRICRDLECCGQPARLIVWEGREIVAAYQYGGSKTSER